jgi:hypothetical protein
MATGNQPARSPHEEPGITSAMSGLEYLLPFALVFLRNPRLADLPRRIQLQPSSFQRPESNRYKGANRNRCNLFKTNEGDQF